MKWYQRVKYMMTQMFHRKISLLTSMIAVTIAFLFLNVILYNFGERYYNELSVCRVLHQPENIYHVEFLDLNMNDVNAGKAKEVIRELKDKPGISAGKFYMHNLRFKELQKEEYYQANHREWVFELSAEKEALMEQMNVDGLSDLFFIDQQLLPMCPVLLTDGRKMEDVVQSYDGQNPIFVGYDYREVINVGETLTVEDTNQKFVVAGILKKDSQWFSDSDVDTSKGTFPLDHYFVSCAREKPMKRMEQDTDYQWEEEVNDTVFTYYNSVYFIADGAVEDQMIKSELEAIGKKYDFPIQCRNVMDILQESIKKNAEELRLFILSALIALFVTALSIGMASVTSLLIRRKEYAVMSANGFLLSDIRQMILLENVIKIGIPLVASYQLMKGTCDKLEVSHLCLGISAVYAVLLVVLCTVIPVFLLKQMDMTELLGGECK